MSKKKTARRTCLLRVSFYKETLRTEMVVFILWKLLKKRSTDTTKHLSVKVEALGELGHPEGPTVNLDRVSHKIVDLHKEGTNFVGKAQLLNTPMGTIAQSLLDDGVTLGVSSRGMGSLKDTSEGYKVVGEDFMLATAADIVADPSAPDAFVNGIMEGVDWIWESWNLKSKTI